MAFRVFLNQLRGKIGGEPSRLNGSPPHFSRLLPP
jgi:hypothetical protein